MSDEWDNQTHDESETASNGESARQPRGEVSYQTMATRNLQRARKMASSNEPDAEGLRSYLIQSATVLAILELADAIRSSNRSS